MIVRGFVRYFQSKFTLLLTLVLSLIVITSYYSTFLQKKEWVQVLNSGATDVNLEMVSSIIESYTGLYYFEQFLLSSDYLWVFCIILLIGLGVGVGAEPFIALQSNYGTLLMTRMMYATYLRNILAAQALYVLIYILSFFTGVLIITLLVFSGDLTVPASSALSELSMVSYAAILTGTIFHIILFMIATLFLATVSPIFFDNRYIVQMVPLMIVIVCIIIGGTLGNINGMWAQLVLPFSLNQVIHTLYYRFITDMSSAEMIIQGLTYIGICIIIFGIVYRYNVRKFGGDYLL